VTEMLGRSHGRAHGGWAWAQLRDGIGSGSTTKGRTISSYVVGFAVGSLDIPGVRSNGNGISFPVADIAILVASGTEPARRKSGVCCHFGELVTGNLSPSLFLRLGERERATTTATPSIDEAGVIQRWDNRIVARVTAGGGEEEVIPKGGVTSRLAHRNPKIVISDGDSRVEIDDDAVSLVVGWRLRNSAGIDGSLNDVVNVSVAYIGRDIVDEGRLQEQSGTWTVSSSILAQHVHKLAIAEILQELRKARSLGETGRAAGP